MLLTSARVVPDKALDSRVSSLQVTSNDPSAWATDTKGCNSCVKVPKGPLIVMSDPTI